MKSKYVAAMSPKQKRSLKQLGSNLAIARKKRGLSVDIMCQRMLVSKQTLRRLETGDPSVSLGAFAMALYALGEGWRLDLMMDVATDDVGLLNDINNLPIRIRSLKNKIEA